MGATSKASDQKVLSEKFHPRCISCIQEGGAQNIFWKQLDFLSCNKSTKHISIITKTKQKKAVKLHHSVHCTVYSAMQYNVHTLVLATSKPKKKKRSMLFLATIMGEREWEQGLREEGEAENI